MSSQTMSDVGIQTLSVMAGGGPHDGRLVLVGGHLVAVFVWVQGDESDDGRDRSEGWFLEAGFGPCSSMLTPQPSIFDTLEQAVAWVVSQSSQKPVPTENVAARPIKRS